MLVGVLLKIDNESNISYSYPYVKPYKNDWKTLYIGTDTLKLYEENRIIILSAGKYIGDNTNSHDTETIHWELSINKTSSKITKTEPHKQIMH